MQGKRVLITGVHKGLGHALATLCLERGATVYALSREAPEDLARHSRHHFASLDLRRLDAIEGALHELLEDAESLDLVLLNAGILGELKDLAETNLDEMAAVMDINVWANKVLLDALTRWGRSVAQIVGISSGAAVNGSAGWGAYSISKAALNLLLRVFAHEHEETHCVALAPGVIETAMIQEVLATRDDGRYGALGRIRQAADDGKLLSPRSAAENILDRLDALRTHESGSYLDIREMA